MRLTLVCMFLFGLFAQSAFAHAGIGGGMSFATGVAHPFSGIDHIAIMTSIGFWAAVKGGRATWVWPAIFVAVMVGGCTLGMMHVQMPFVEPGILCSVIVVGVVLAAAIEIPVLAGAAMIGVFALLHGHAHGAEAADSVNAAQYMAGFVVATCILLAVGVGASVILRRVTSVGINRVAGGICVAVGAGLVAGVL
jgi:urease accessory protein